MDEDMNWKLYIPILTLIVPIQTTVSHSLSVQGTIMDLGLVLSCLIGIKAGKTHGLLMGALIGIQLDLFSGGPFGLNLVTKSLVGWGSGFIGKIFLDLRMPGSFGIFSGISLLSGILFYIFLQVLRGSVEFTPSFRWIILPQALYDGLGGAILLQLFPQRSRIKTVLR